MRRLSRLCVSCFGGNGASCSRPGPRPDDGADHAGRGRPPVDSHGVKSTGSSHNEANSSTSMPRVDDGVDAPRGQPLSDVQRRETTGGDHGAVGAEEDAHGRRRLTAAECLEEEEVLYHIAIALSLDYKDLPELTDLDGFRGFKLQEDGGGAEAVGQSSNDPEAVPAAYCNICMEKKYSFECMAMKGCEHTYCACCVSQYVASKVEANEATVRCPDPRCEGGFLEPEMCRFILPPDVLDRWGARLCEEGIPATEKCYCPYRDCSALLIGEVGNGGEVDAKSQCPHCGKLVCARCRVAWHAGLECEEYQKLAAGDRSREDVMVMRLAKERKWQRCPKCGFLVDRTDGCNYMRCRCRHTFCYKCAGPVNKIDHSCPVCKIWG